MELEKFTIEIEKSYNSFKEQTLTIRRFKHADILPLIKKLSNNSIFEVTEIGKSTEGKGIFLIKAGKGKTKVLLWSQMHGNEPTATAALFDMLNFLNTDYLNSEKSSILNELSLYIVPMVNPDGTELFKRRNALDIDLNRDAARLEADETRILKKLRDEIEPDFGFNLHDQEIYYTAGATEKPATISFLAPSFNNEKDIDHSRRNAMELIVLMEQVLQNYIPGQIGRYNDDFMPTAFGDNMQRWGTSTILIESGGYKNDPEKQLVRKMNFLCMMAALYSLSSGNQEEVYYMDYFKIPENKKEKLFDLLIRNANLKVNSRSISIDIGIRRKEIDNQTFTNFEYKGEIAEIGDLTYYFGFDEIDAKNLNIKSAEKYLLIGNKADFQLIDNDENIVYNVENGFVVE